MSLISQFLGYGLFNAAGSLAPRCAYANLTVNGQNLGVCTHAERIHKPLLRRAFGNDDGVLYEGTVVDFYPNWAGSLEQKVGQGRVGRQKIQQLIEVLGKPDENIEVAIGQLVDLDSFYTFWPWKVWLVFGTDTQATVIISLFISIQRRTNSILSLGEQIIYSRDIALLETIQRIQFQLRNRV